MLRRGGEDWKHTPKYQQLSLDGTVMGNFEFLLYALLRKLNFFVAGLH